MAPFLSKGELRRRPHIFPSVLSCDRDVTLGLCLSGKRVRCRPHICVVPVSLSSTISRGSRALIYGVSEASSPDRDTTETVVLQVDSTC